MNEVKVKQPKDQDIINYLMSKFKKIVCFLYSKVHRILSRMKNEEDINVKLFQSLLHKLKEGVVFVEAKEDGTLGEIIGVNDRDINQLGYTKEEVINKSVYDFIEENEIASAKQNAKELALKGQINCETIIITKEKKKRDIEVSAHIVELDGKKISICIWHDITERKNAERVLKQTEERYRKLVELLPDAVHIKQKRKIIYSNEAGAKLFGFRDPKELIGKNDLDFTHPDYRELSLERGKNIISFGEKVPLIEAKAIRDNGEIINVEVASTRVEYNGSSAILSVLRDITERKKAEECLKRIIKKNKELLRKAVENEKLKTEILTNISHEFKTPLNVILGAIQLLNGHMENGNDIIDQAIYHKYVGMMKQNCYRLVRLINNLIDINKIDSGNLELNFNNHNIINIVENVTISVAEYAKNEGLSIIFDTEIEEKIISCDEEKIERIMLNLLSNAIKYSKGSGQIDVYMYEQNENIMITVKDTGIGIPKDKIDHIFGRFKQVDTSLHRANEGSGIGLALVQSLVEKHEGEIWVESKFGEGTKFFIQLPVKALPEKDYIIRNTTSNNSIVEKIHIEFSDIYKLNE